MKKPKAGLVSKSKPAKTVSDEPKVVVHATYLDLARVDFLFFSSFLKTKDENTGQTLPFLQPENGYEYLQEPLAALLDPSIRQVFLHKGRQMFFSWEYGGWELWRMNCCLANEVWFSGLMAHREDDVKPLIDRLWFMYSHLPGWLRSPLAMHNTMQLHLAGTTKGPDGKPLAKSGIDGYPANAEVGRSRTFSSFRVEEAAFVPEFSKVVASVIPTMSKGQTKFCALSTTRGRASDFVRIIEQPDIEPTTRVLRIFRGRHPIYKTEEFKRTKIAELMAAGRSLEEAREIFGQEYEGSLEGGEGLIYPTFNEVTHICQDFDIPKTWAHGVYIDPHPSKSTAILLVAASPADTLYLCDSVWMAESSDKLMSQARTQWALKKITRWLIDPHCDNENNLVGKGEAVNIFKLFQQEIPLLEKAPGTPEARIDATRQRLKVRPLTGQPGLKVFSSQKRIIWEFKHYSTKKDLNDQPVIIKKDDDFMDCTGYACVSPPETMSYEAVGEWKTPVMGSMRR